jgi:ribosomal protein S7
MYEGKKSVAEQIVYGAFEIDRDEAKQEPARRCSSRRSTT